MESIDTAYNGFLLCIDCKYRPDEPIEVDKEFHCDRQSMSVRNVGICKYYTRIEIAES